MGLAYARSRKLEKKENKIRDKKLKAVQLKLNLCMKSNPVHHPVFQEVADEIGQDIILEDLNLNSEKNPHARRYSDATYSFSARIHQASPSIYQTICEKLALPTAQALYNKYKGLFCETKEELLDLEKLKNILQNWRHSNGIHYDDHINVAVSVDAISFKPNITINSSGIIQGLLNPMTICKEEFLDLKNDKQNLARFLSMHFDEAVTSAFVYQIQSLSGNYQHLIAYIEPNTNGKAGTQQVESLKRIRKIASSCKINVKVFTFDGDNGYNEFHETYFNSWYSYVGISDHVYDECTQRRLRIVGDPLHILKRVRYRLLDNQNIIIGLTPNDQLIDIELIKEQLSKTLPEVVFSNEKYTKMHDKLPGQLFSAESLKVLCQHENYNAVGYFLPWTLILLALTNENLNSNNAYDLLEIAFYYIYYYINAILENKDVIRQTMSEKKNVSKPLLMYPLNLSKEILNSLHSLLMLFVTENELCIDNCTTRPLEHTFGITRKRAKYRQKYDVIMDALTKSNFTQFLDESNSSISGRIAHFGRKITFDENNYSETFSYSNRTIGLALSWLYKNPESQLLANKEYIIVQFLYELLNNDEIITSKNQCTKLTINSLLLGTQNSSRIRESLYARSAINKMIKSDSAPVNVEKQLQSMFSRKLNLQEVIKLLELLGQSLTRQEKRKRLSCIAILSANWNKYKEQIQEIASDTQKIATVMISDFDPSYIDPNDSDTY